MNIGKLFGENWRAFLFGVIFLCLSKLVSNRSVKKTINIFKLIYGGFWILNTIGIFVEIFSRNSFNPFSIFKLIAANAFLSFLFVMNGINGLKQRKVNYIYLILESILSLFYIVITSLAVYRPNAHISHIILFSLLNGGLLFFIIYNFIQIIKSRRVETSSE